MNTREIASRVLRIFEKKKRIPEDEVRRALSRMDERDRAFFKELVWGVVRKRRLLDWYIDRFLRRKEIPPAVRVLLRMGVYQILFMDSVPNYAAVNETVALAENKSFKRLINAILRKVSSMEIEEPSELSLKYSHPEWLVNYWKSFLKEEIVEEILRWNMVPSPIVLRVNTLKITREELMGILREEGHEVSE
ncbi:MAG TPA: 16S rRNA (cytosine(967)-C(5))-methyltransferase, partial [Thermotoga sp.]|nr:16S rRNA (cytosine(967)-C(5))-methyltransferase [Thermotoga sp.]